MSADRRRLPPRHSQIGVQFESEDGTGFELLQHGQALGDNLLHQPTGDAKGDGGGILYISAAFAMDEAGRTWKRSSSV